jgi:hypothetical protein
MRIWVGIAAIKGSHLGILLRRLYRSRNHFRIDAPITRLVEQTNGPAQANIAVYVHMRIKGQPRNKVSRRTRSDKFIFLLLGYLQDLMRDEGEQSVTNSTTWTVSVNALPRSIRLGLTSPPLAAPRDVKDSATRAWQIPPDCGA